MKNSENNAKAARERRLAEALRDNLHRRKAQERHRHAPQRAPDGEKPGPENKDDA